MQRASSLADHALLNDTVSLRHNIKASIIKLFTLINYQVILEVFLIWLAVKVRAQTIATVCMFLACKAEETPRWLGELVVVAYKLIYKWDPSASRRIREIYDKQKELILIGERLLLNTIAFDMNIERPYKPLVAALKRLDITDKELVKVAWNFVNDCLRSELCLQHKPHYIAAGSLFLAAKVKKVKLPTTKGKAWWMEFDVSPKQLEEVIQQMMSSWEQGQKQALALKDQNLTEPQIRKVTTNSPQSCTLSGSSIGHDSKTIASKDTSEPATSATSNCVKKLAIDCIRNTSIEKINRQASNSGSANSFENSKMLASTDLFGAAESAASVCVKKQAFDNIHNTSRETLNRQASNSGSANRFENSKMLASTDLFGAAKSVASDRVKKQAFDNGDITSKETPNRQTSDTGSAVSVVEDGDSGEPVEEKSDPSSSCKIVSVGAVVGNCRVDVNRIREKLKKRNIIQTTKRKYVEDIDDEMDGEAWIERELENGIVLESSYSEKQRKVSNFDN